MYTIIILTVDDNRAELCCANSRNIDVIVKTLESSPYCLNFKIVDSDNGVITDMKKLGLDNHGKFCTSFPSEKNN